MRGIVWRFREELQYIVKTTTPQHESRGGGILLTFNNMCDKMFSEQSKAYISQERTAGKMEKKKKIEFIKNPTGAERNPLTEEEMRKVIGRQPAALW
ncbi:MAG: hypothetical protein LBC95_00715 [Candidatus Nomurabacteria bacterium]|jgi:hypothetical protein|nr:hypothetical protein [Candidatus Nomurabacteria bacterium]